MSGPEAILHNIGYTPYTMHGSVWKTLGLAPDWCLRGLHGLLEIIPQPMLVGLFGLETEHCRIQI